MPESNPFVIETRDLVKVYKEGNIRAVDGLNLNVRKGEIYAFVGANGSGKTTSINMLTGILKPTSGTIQVLGCAMPQDRHLISRNIGVAPQEYSVYSDLSVEENIRFFGKLNQMQPRDLEAALNDVLKILNLEGKREAVVANLSGGMKRRVSIACALIHSPKLVFFDEATVGIDPVLRSFFWTYFRTLRDAGITLVITSHVMDEAEKADRIGLMRGGKLIEEGTPAELRAKYGAKTIEEIFITLSKGVMLDE